MFSFSYRQSWLIALWDISNVVARAGECVRPLVNGEDKHIKKAAPSKNGFNE
jgi:hypothetical protein